MKHRVPTIYLWRINEALVLVVVKCHYIKMVTFPFYLFITPLIKPEATNQLKKYSHLVVEPFNIQMSSKHLSLWFIIMSIKNKNSIQIHLDQLTYVLGSEYLSCKSLRFRSFLYMSPDFYKYFIL